MKILVNFNLNGYGVDLILVNVLEHVRLGLLGLYELSAGVA
jgi:hypothetical protein